MNFGSISLSGLSKRYPPVDFLWSPSKSHFIKFIHTNLSNSGESESPQQNKVLLQSIDFLSLKCLVAIEVSVNQKELTEYLGLLAKNPCLDNNQHQEEFVDTFLPIHYSFSYSVESPGVCFVIGISGNRKIHFSNELQDPRELLLCSKLFSFRLWFNEIETAFWGEISLQRISSHDFGPVEITLADSVVGWETCTGDGAGSVFCSGVLKSETWSLLAFSGACVTPAKQSSFTVNHLTTDKNPCLWQNNMLVFTKLAVTPNLIK